MRRAEQLEVLRLVGRAEHVRVGRVRLLDRRAVRQAALREPLAHLLAAAELLDERAVEPRLVDAQMRVREQAVAVEALDVVALVRRAVAPDLDAVLGHRAHEQRPGDGAAERRRVEVAPAGGLDVERAALERGEALARERVAAVDEHRVLGAVELRPVGNAPMSGSSYWPRSAVKAYGIAPCSRIQASAQQVSRPPENAIPTRSPTGSEPRMTPPSERVDAHAAPFEVVAELRRRARAASRRRARRRRSCCRPRSCRRPPAGPRRRSRRRAARRTRAASGRRAACPVGIISPRPAPERRRRARRCAARSAAPGSA